MAFGISPTSMTRRRFIQTSGACAASVMLGGGAALAQAAGKKPNIVLILADDLGYGDLGCYGATDTATPNIDALAAAGIRFTDAYSCAPLCSPARAGMLTGRCPQRFGFEFNPFPRSTGGWGLPDSERLFSEDLKAAGYATGLVGKWHLGPGANQHPLKHGFDEFFGFIGGKHRYLEEGRKDPNSPILRGMEVVEEKEYLTEAFTREAVSFIERNRQRPFFLYLAPNAVHVPLQKPPEKYLSRVAKIADEPRRIFAAILAALDDQVGAVKGKLKELGLLENTLIIFMSDNGGAIGPSKNGELRGVKTDLFEGGIRVPMILNWAGKIKAGVDAGLASILDLYPTFLSAAGAAPGADRAELDGINLLAGRARHEALFWRYGPEMAVRSGKWKLVGLKDGSHQLFDLAADVGEKNDLAEKEPGRVKDLLAQWKKWDAKNIEPKWAGYQKNE